MVGGAGMLATQHCMVCCVFLCALVYVPSGLTSVAEFHGMWENLIYDVDIKEKVSTGLLLMLAMNQPDWLLCCCLCLLSPAAELC